MISANENTPLIWTDMAEGAKSKGEAALERRYPTCVAAAHTGRGRCQKTSFESGRRCILPEIDSIDSKLRLVVLRHREKCKVMK